VIELVQWPPVVTVSTWKTRNGIGVVWRCIAGNLPLFSSQFPVHCQVMFHVAVPRTVKYRSFADGPACGCLDESTRYV
jgi:hypothetical protein